MYSPVIATVPLCFNQAEIGIGLRNVEIIVEYSLSSL